MFLLTAGLECIVNACLFFNALIIASRSAFVTLAGLLYKYISNCSMQLFLLLYGYFLLFF